MLLNSIIPILQQRILRFKERLSYLPKVREMASGRNGVCVQVSVALLPLKPARQFWWCKPILGSLLPAWHLNNSQLFSPGVWMKLATCEGLKNAVGVGRTGGWGPGGGASSKYALSTLQLLLRGTIFIWYKRAPGKLQEVACLCAIEQLKLRTIFTRKFLST